jgi:hypothetical protein
MRASSISLFSLFIATISALLRAPVFTGYVDDGLNWQTLESGALRVHWYEAEAAFGQAALDAAQAGFASIGKLLPPDLSQPVDIFLYKDVTDLRGAVDASDPGWLAGHADPALGVVRVVVEPDADQRVTMDQRIPHELMHVMLYRRLGPGYGNVPAWLREGMATLVETSPNPEYERVLAEEAARRRLLPLADLCRSFPAGAGQAFLAYAEARSFALYLQETYGSSGLLDLASAYAAGADCESGSERALGIPLTRLEEQWQASVLGKPAPLRALQNITPYLVLLCLVLGIPLLGIAGTLHKKGSRHEPETYVRRE